MSEETMSLGPTTIKWMGSRLGREAMESRVQILEAKGMSPKESYLMPRCMGVARSSPPLSEDHRNLSGAVLLSSLLLHKDNTGSPSTREQNWTSFRGAKF
mgnify:CR=1 FL=1